MTTNLLETAGDYTGAPMAENAPNPSTNPDGRPANVPEKFWDKATQTIRVDALLASYAELEKKLSQRAVAPALNLTDETTKIALLKELGLPDDPSGYQIQLKSDQIQLDPDLNAKLHAAGFTAPQVQLIYDLLADELVPLLEEFHAELSVEQEREKLVQHFGGEKSWGEVAAQLKNYGSEHLPPSVFEALSQTFDGILALYQMMSKKEPGLVTRGGQDADQPADEKQLRQMMRDPKYWREKDPQFISRVAAGFDRVYAG